MPYIIVIKLIYNKNFITFINTYIDDYETMEIMFQLLNNLFNMNLPVTLYSILLTIIITIIRYRYKLSKKFPVQTGETF